MEGIELVKAAVEGLQPAYPPKPSLEDDLTAEFLTPRPQFSTDWLDQFHPATDDLTPLQSLERDLAEMPSVESRITLQFKRFGLDGHVAALEERVAPPSSANSGRSLDITRQMGAKKDAVRGSSGRMPFTPGGIELSATSQPKNLHRSPEGLLDIAPGLSRSMRPTVPDTDESVDVDKGDEDEESEEGTIKDEDSADGEAGDLTVDLDEEDESDSEDKNFTSVDYLLPDGISFVRQTPSAAVAPPKKVWAHMVDVNQRFENFHELVPNPARVWPFELDNFQKEAVFHLEQGDSVFVAAHTSAGKTVVAEYAMSMAVKHMTKCIYTSPIKALSNQKYRDFSREYDDVGILTGDVQLNPEATTLIMTTEILRSMLYRGADIIRDVEFIIFDEVHYVNDSERGVVWEEVIIMLPDHVKLILLSATVPNTFEFANWIGRTKEKDVYVIATPKRPVPLRHHLWARKKLFEVVGEDRQFNEKGWRALSDTLNPPSLPSGPAGDRKGSARGGARGGAAAGGRGGRGAARGGRGGRGASGSGQVALQRQLGPQTGRFNNSTPSKQVFQELVAYLKKESLLPAVIFVFSRKMCEQYALSLRSLDLNTGREKAEVFMFMDKATRRLRKEDRELPQILMLREFLQRGIGVHHSGLLPIMKEVVEILFARGLVKILFATETFAMGLNLPTRTVVFSAVRKFDSKTMRLLTPGEYTQMAGRAGRRGLDKVGTVIILNNSPSEAMPQSELKSMILGTPTKLSSQFRLTYTMILSLLRIEAVKVEDVIRQSFSENATHVLRPEREKQVILLEQQLTELRNQAQGKKQWPPGRFDALLELWHAFEAYQYHQTILYELAITIKRFVGHWCVYRSANGTGRAAGLIQNLTRGGVTILTVAYSAGGSRKSVKPVVPFFGANRRVPDIYGKGASMPYAQVPFSSIELISARRVKLQSLPSKKADRQHEIQRLLYEYISDGTILNEVSSLSSLRSPEARSSLEERNKIADRINSTLLPQVEGRIDPALWAVIHQAGTLEVQIAQLRASATSQNTELMPDYEQRLSVLKQANYVDDNLNVMLKGRVACEITTGYELYITELILDNFFGPYEPEEVVALLSAFVFEGVRGVDDSDISVTPRLDDAKVRVLEIVDYVHGLAEEHQVQITQDEAEFAEKGRFALMQVVYEWARGLSFSEITTLTTVQEGLIVRVINRLDEVCRAVMSAARIIGDVDLYDKIAVAQERIKRDIVFCSSLYL